MNFLILLFTALVIVPIALWIMYIRYEDRSEVEPRKLIRRCLYVGVAAAVMAALSEFFIYDWLGIGTDMYETTGIVTIGFVASIFLAGPIEELFKYIVLRYSVYFTTDFNQAFDSVVYGIMIALGFSFIENCAYFYSLQVKDTMLAFIFFVFIRGIFTTLMHVTATGIMGLYVGRAKFATSGSRLLMIKGVALAALIHGTFNALLAIPYGIELSIPFIVVIFLIFQTKWDKPDVRMIWRAADVAPTR